MVDVHRKYGREMPVGSMVKDIGHPNDGVFHVTSYPRTTLWGTEIGLVTDSGQTFMDFASNYKPFI